MKTIIIAEAGVNHNGDVKLAYKLIDAAAKAGADFIKFQHFVPEEIVTPYASKADYQKKNEINIESQLDMLKNLTLKESEYQKLKIRCKRKKISFLSSPFDIKSIYKLKKLGLNVYKVPSGEINNVPLLREIGKLKKKIILSTGMANLDEIKIAIRLLTSSGCPKNKISILHCNTEYPTPYKDVNLNCIKELKNQFKVKVGLSDHSNGIEVPIAAVALGATIIEKHLTLDRKLTGPDHKASLEPNEFKLMVNSIRNIEKAMGHKIKKPTESEKKNILIVRKSIVASKKIKKNEKFSPENITTKRPGLGISAINWDKVIGKKSKYEFNKNDFIKL